MSKPFKDLTIKEAFMFAAVMVNPDKCSPFLEMVLDMDALLSGKRYRELPDTYVIFPCRKSHCISTVITVSAVRMESTWKTGVQRFS